MSTSACNQQNPKQHCGSGFVIVIVLYILLAIMISSFAGC